MQKPVAVVSLCLFIVSLLAGAELTSYEGMRERLASLNLPDGSRVESIGTSVEGRELPAVFLTESTEATGRLPGQPLLLLFAQQHGDEPAGKEAALGLLDWITTDGRDVLEQIDLIVVPCLNPDGAEKLECRNANNMDLNRNHLVLSEPETRALHRLYREWMPEVTLDAHEYNPMAEVWIEHGYVKNADVMLGCMTNPNISGPGRDFADSVMIPETESRVKAAGYSFSEYIVGNPFVGGRLRYGSMDINDSRNLFGLYGSLAFVQTGNRFGDPQTELAHRIATQTAGLVAFVQIIASHTDQIRDLVGSGRESMSLYQPGYRPALSCDYFPDPARRTVTLPVFDLYNWKATERELDRFQPQIRKKLTIAEPTGYVVPPGQERLLEILDRHGIAFERLKEPRKLDVEVLIIREIGEQEEEELTLPLVKIEAEEATREAPAGSAVIPLLQPARRLLPLMLEPQSTRGLVTEPAAHHDHFGEWLKAGEEYPVWRLK